MGAERQEHAGTASRPDSGPPVRRPEEIREYESRVWDLTRNLINPAFLYVVLQVAFWCALDRNPAFRGDALSFWDHAGLHALQFLGAWGVFYGTLLRDMRFRSRVVTVVLWLTMAAVAGAWLWPGADDAAEAPALWALLWAQLAVGVAGWALIMVAWFRAKARHVAAATEPGS